MANYPLHHKISNNTHVSTEKEKFPTSFFYFAFFSKLVFLCIKNQFYPHYLSHFKSDRAENFSGGTSTDLG
jgi:hypothetical protein